MRQREGERLARDLDRRQAHDAIARQPVPQVQNFVLRVNRDAAAGAGYTVAQPPIRQPLHRNHAGVERMKRHNLPPAVPFEPGEGVARDQQRGDQRLPRLEGRLRRVRHVVQDRVERMLHRLPAPAVVGAPVKVERNRRERLRHGRDARLRRRQPARPLATDKPAEPGPLAEELREVRVGGGHGFRAGLAGKQAVPDAHCRIHSRRQRSSAARCGVGPGSARAWISVPS